MTRLGLASKYQTAKPIKQTIFWYFNCLILIQFDVFFCRFHLQLAIFDATKEIWPEHIYFKLFYENVPQFVLLAQILSGLGQIDDRNNYYQRKIHWNFNFVKWNSTQTKNCVLFFIPQIPLIAYYVELLLSRYGWL